MTWSGVNSKGPYRANELMKGSVGPKASFTEKYAYTAKESLEFASSIIINEHSKYASPDLDSLVASSNQRPCTTCFSFYSLELADCMDEQVGAIWCGEGIQPQALQ